MTRDIQRFLESNPFQYAITGIIVLNAILLGLETSPDISAHWGTWLNIADVLILSIFVIELTIRIIVYRSKFFTDPWSLFDFAVVTIALVPNSGPFAVLRALRVLRVLRLVSVSPSMRSVVSALLLSLPGLGAIVALLMLIFYVAAVMATTLFGESFPEWFGSLGASFYSLFQIMTLESWSMGIVRPVMEVYPYAWLFFVPFILIATFTMLNLFIAVVVNAMQTKHELEQGQSDQQVVEQAHFEREQIQQELKEIRNALEKLTQRVD